MWCSAALHTTFVVMHSSYQIISYLLIRRRTCLQLRSPRPLFFSMLSGPNTAQLCAFVHLKYHYLVRVYQDLICSVHSTHCTVFVFVHSFTSSLFDFQYSAWWWHVCPFVLVYSSTERHIEFYATSCHVPKLITVHTLRITKRTLFFLSIVLYSTEGREIF